MSTRNNVCSVTLRQLLFVSAGALFFLTGLAGELQASIVLKVMAANPSKEDAQIASIKAYLPKEVKPDDVLGKGDLQLVYDSQQGSYFVSGDFELKPGETFEQDIELRDIWSVPVNEIETLRHELERIGKQLKNTEYADRFEGMYKEITLKLDQIESAARFPPANPEQHISSYREHLNILLSIRADLDLARGFMSQSRAYSTGAIFKFVGAVMLFLGILGASFYFVWLRQLNAVAGASGSSAETPAGGAGADRKGPSAGAPPAGKG